MKADDSNNRVKEEMVREFVEYLGTAISIGKNLGGLEETVEIMGNYYAPASGSFFPYVNLEEALFAHYRRAESKMKSLLPENRTAMQRLGLHLRTLFMYHDEKGRYIKQKNRELYAEMAPALKQMYFTARVLVSLIKSLTEFVRGNEPKQMDEKRFLTYDFSTLNARMVEISIQSQPVEDAIHQVKSNDRLLYPQKTKEWHDKILYAHRMKNYERGWVGPLGR